MSSIAARIDKLCAAQAARAAAVAKRPPLDRTSRAARAAALVGIADFSAPMTGRNLRACRVYELMQLAQGRAASNPH